MNVDLGIWGKLTRFAIFLFIVAGVLAVAVWYLPLIRQNERYRQRVLELDAQIQKEDQTSKQLQASRDALRTNPKAIERLARQRLSCARPGEIVVRFEGSGTNQARF